MMNLSNKRRMGALGVLVTLLAALAVTLGIGSAGAATVCDDETSDLTVNAFGIATVGADPDHTAPNHRKASVCLAPPGGHASVMFTDPNSATPGGTVGVHTCGLVAPTCQWAPNYSGAEVNPSVSTNAPLSGATGTGGTAGVGAGTCAYANGTATCPTGGFTVGGVTVHEGDVSVPTIHWGTGVCVTAGGDPCVTPVPAGIGVGVFRGDSSNDTVTVTVADIDDSEDLGDCVGVNAGYGC